MSEFVLIVLVTMGLTEEPTTFEIRIPKESYKQCIDDSKSYKFPFQELHKVISIKSRCERIIGKQKKIKKSGESI